MPKKSKRRLQASAALQKQRRLSAIGGATSTLSQSQSQSQADETVPTPPSLPPVSPLTPVSEESGDDTEPESSDNEEPDVRSQEEILEDFCLEWMVTLDNDEKSLWLFFCAIFLPNIMA